MSHRNHVRRCVVATLDKLVNGSEWTGNVQEVAYAMRDQGHANTASDYMIRRVLRDYGVELGRGQYHVAFASLTGRAPSQLGDERT